MAENNQTRLARKASRILKIYEAHGNAAHPGIAAVGVTASKAASAYLAAEAAVQSGQSTASREHDEGTAAIQALRAAYDHSRTVVQSMAPHEAVGPAGSMIGVPEDVLLHAERVEAVLLKHNWTQWAPALLVELTPAVEAASREWAEGATALDALQKTRGARATAAVALEGELVKFRRVVRKELGSTSREYQSIRRRAGAPDDTTDADATDSPAAAEPAA